MCGLDLIGLVTRYTLFTIDEYRWGVWRFHKGNTCFWTCRLPLLGVSLLMDRLQTCLCRAHIFWGISAYKLLFQEGTLGGLRGTKMVEYGVIPKIVEARVCGLTFLFCSKRDRVSAVDASRTCTVPLYLPRPISSPAISLLFSLIPPPQPLHNLTRSQKFPTLLTPPICNTATASPARQL